MKKLLACVFAAVIMSAMVGCNSAPASTTDSSSSAVADETSAASTQTEKVSYEDFDAQEKLSKSIQNGELTGATVEIEGVSKKLGSHYTIGQSKDGSFTGTSYEFSGEYPADGAHVKLTGTVVGSGIVFKIEATSIEVIE